MKRKVIHIGTASGITLPVVWTDEMKIKKGQELDVSIKGRKLIVGVESESEVSRCKIHVSGKNEIATWWSIVPLYELGYDEIEVTFDNPETAVIINHIAKEQLGCIVSEKTDKKCVLKSIAKETEFDPVLNRAFETAIELGKQSLELIKKDELKELKNVKSLEYTLNSLVGFCHRMLNKEGYKEPRKVGILYAIIKHLEFVGDMFDEINATLMESPKLKLEKDFIKIYGMIVEAISKAHKLINKCDENSLEEFVNFREEILSEIKKSKDPLTKMIMRNLRKAVGDFVPLIHSLHH
ncbi:MAG: hypothetical protein Q8R00_00565 [Candidatus Nanoarchaeia archaeon]|nr:hypothetical protein [Candidatus Nanoarchaeia archaeon]